MTHYWVESAHGVTVDVKLDAKAAKESAQHLGKSPRAGTTPCKVYYFGAKGLKVYLK